MRKGFTLAELLIALAILGVIATFTIPKVLQSQQDGKYKAVAKEAVGAMSDAYAAATVKGRDPNLAPADLTPYLNYVKLETTGTIDSYYGDGTPTRNCANSTPCLRLHNGAVLYLNGNSFNGTATTNGIWFRVDPDGKVTDGTATGPGKAQGFFIYYNGRIVNAGDCLTGTTNDTGVVPCAPGQDPPWFSWN